MKLSTIQTAALEGKKVLVRLDTDVPFSDSHEILDTTRLTAGCETISYLLTHGATVIIIGHAGRPEGKVDPNLSLKPVAVWFAQKFSDGNCQDTTRANFSGWQLSENLTVLENLRFFAGEEKNDDEFAKQLGSLADIYVDDAFAVSHRSAASNVGVTKYIPSYAGIQLQKEIEGLSKVVENPQRPLLVIIGGAKLETKLPLVAKMHQIADVVLVGGKLVQEKALLDEEIKKEGKAYILVAHQNETGFDITKESSDAFVGQIEKAKTIVWNGPVGKTNGDDANLAGTRAIAAAMLTTDAYTVIGGGDSIEFLDREKLLDKFSFVSTGGGAMLSFLSGEVLPALPPLASH